MSSGEQRAHQIGRLDTQHIHDLSRFLVEREYALIERHRFHARNRLKATQVGHRQGGLAVHRGADIEHVRGSVGDGPVYPGLHALQNAEQGEGHTDLQKNQRRSYGLAPDAVPEERQELHAAVLPCRHIPSRYGVAQAAGGISRKVTPRGPRRAFTDIPTSLRRSGSQRHLRPESRRKSSELSPIPTPVRTEVSGRRVRALSVSNIIFNYQYIISILQIQSRQW